MTNPPPLADRRRRKLVAFGVAVAALSSTFFATRDQPAPVASAGKNDKPAL